MSEYKSPIKVTFEDISNEVINRYDDEIICRVKKITGIDVDKERLINALLLDKKLVTLIDNCIKKIMFEVVKRLNDKDEIVRCKDCKQWDAELGCCTSYTIVKCTDGREGVSSDPDDFCSQGVKR